MARPTKQQKLAILDRRRNIGRRYIQGQTQWQIARSLGVDQGTVSRDLAALHVEWLAEANIDTKARVAKEMAKIDAVELEAYRGWRRSLKDAEKKFAKVKSEPAAGPDGRPMAPKVIGQETHSTQEGQAGDPKFLDIVLKCVERRCKLMGADAPTKFAPTTPDGKSLPTQVIRIVAPAGTPSLDERGFLERQSLNGHSDPSAN